MRDVFCQKSSKTKLSDSLKNGRYISKYSDTIKSENGAIELITFYNRVSVYRNSKLLKDVLKRTYIDTIRTENGEIDFISVHKKVVVRRNNKVVKWKRYAINYREGRKISKDEEKNEYVIRTFYNRWGFKTGKRLIEYHFHPPPGN